MTTGPLGGQTATVIAQVQLPGGRHNEREDGARTSASGCSLQPDGQPAESTNREERTVTRWRLFAPAGFRAAAVDECEVVPGPLAEDGVTPARLKFTGAAQPWHDELGVEHHVEAFLTRRTG